MADLTEVRTLIDAEAQAHGLRHEVGGAGVVGEPTRRRSGRARGMDRSVELVPHPRVEQVHELRAGIQDAFGMSSITTATCFIASAVHLHLSWWALEDLNL
jgi:hypothetical protein